MLVGGAKQIWSLPEQGATLVKPHDLNLSCKVAEFLTQPVIMFEVSL